VTYTAPANRVLTCLHIPEPGADRTRCGLPMDEDGLWQPVKRQAGDRICRNCAEDRAWDEAQSLERIF